MIYNEETNRLERTWSDRARWKHPVYYLLNGFIVGLITGELIFAVVIL